MWFPPSTQRAAPDSIGPALPGSKLLPGVGMLWSESTDELEAEPDRSTVLW